MWLQHRLCNLWNPCCSRHHGHSLDSLPRSRLSHITSHSAYHRAGLKQQDTHRRPLRSRHRRSHHDRLTTESAKSRVREHAHTTNNNSYANSHQQLGSVTSVSAARGITRGIVAAATIARSSVATAARGAASSDTLRRKVNFHLPERKGVGRKECEAGAKRERLRRVETCHRFLRCAWRLWRLLRP